MTDGARFSKQPPGRVSSALVLPKGACDAHGHIFPAPDIYPTHNETMALAPVELYLDVHRQLGFQKGVLVQGGAYKLNKSALLAALDLHPANLRGVALMVADTPDHALSAVVARNVRALRFTKGGASRIDEFAALAPKMREFGLHAEMFIGLENFVSRAPDLMAQRVPLVLDHLGGPFDGGAGVSHPGFQRLLQLMADHELWVKLTPARNSRQFPGYGDVRPFHDALVALHPDRLVWGSDWPFPNMSEQTPDLGELLTLFGDWVTDDSLRHRILVDNPARLYGFT